MIFSHLQTVVHYTRIIISYLIAPPSVVVGHSCLVGAFSNMSLFHLVREISSNEKGVQFLKDKGVLHKRRYCANGHEMTLQLSEKICRWRCGKTQCRTTVGLRNGTWLEGSRLSCDNVVLFIFSWTKEYTTSQFCADELNMSTHSMTDWKNYLREVCADSLLRNPIKIGGPNMTVEIDESCFSRRKYNIGRVYPQQWVFGGICRENNQCFLYAVRDRTAATLLSVIRECINPGTTIMSDLWASYQGISNIRGFNFTHLTVNHSENFVNPVTGAHTQKVESMWSSAKRRNRRECGTHRKMLDSYLCEFMWRKRHAGTDLFEQIIQDIKAFWPPQL